MKRSVFYCFLAGAVLCAPVSGAHAQTLDDWNPEGLVMQRAELESLLERYEDVANSSAYSGRIRDDARTSMQLIRERLEEGDFRVGDQVQLRVQGETEIPPTLPVEPGPRITLPVIGAISLHGVLRSELEEHLTRELGRYIQDPMVEAEAQMRISILGAVGAPGFYHAPSHTLVSETIMLAGGPVQSADYEEMRIERAGEVLLEDEMMTTILADGRTLDQLNLRGGDQIVLPVEQAGSFWSSGWGEAFRWGLGIVATVLFGVGVF